MSRGCVTHPLMVRRTWDRNRRRDGRAVTQRAHVSGKCRVAALEPLFADLLVQVRGVGATGDELGLQVWLELVRGYVPAVAGGDEEGVEVGVAVAADGLAVDVEAAGDLADRVADPDHVVDFFVASPDAVHNQRGRQEIQGGLHGLAVLLVFGVCAQAGAVLVADLFDGEGETAQQMPAVGHLGGVGGGFLDARVWALARSRHAIWASMCSRSHAASVSEVGSGRTSTTLCVSTSTKMVP